MSLFSAISQMLRATKLSVSLRSRVSAPAFLLMSLLCINTGVAAVPQVDDIVESVRKELAPDRRQTVYEVESHKLADGRVKLTGKISDHAIHKSLMDRLANQPGLKVVDEITLLPDDSWGIIRISVACMRTAGKYSAELATQALLGMPVKLLEEKDGWWRIQSPDGYIGWVWRSSLSKKSAQEMADWRKADRLVVTSRYQIWAYDGPESNSSRSIVTDLLPGNIVEGNLSAIENGRVEVTLPDGRKAWADADAFTPIEKWAAQDFDPEVILDQAYAMHGAPYLWGGTSAKATDCSGLVKVSYLANGLILRRDASQQILTGTHLEPEDWRDYQAGDLLFFGEKPGGRATHVAIYDGDGWFIHCAGRVHRSSIDPESPEYINRIFLGASRIHGNEGTEGITFARNHPWYF